MTSEELFLAQLGDARKALAERMRQQNADHYARERTSIEPSAAGDSSVVNAEPGAGGNGGGANSGKSLAPSAGSDSSAVNAEADAGGHGGGAGSGKSRASSEVRDSDCEIVEESADKRKSGASSAGHDSDAQPVESTADGHRQCERDGASSKKRKTSRGKTLVLEAPFSGSGTEQHDPKCLVKHMSPGQSCQVQVETNIPLENLEFLNTNNIESSFDKKDMLVNITALDCTSVKSDFATIQFVHTPTGKVIATIEICNKSSSVNTSSQQSADTDRCAHLAILGLSPNASESDIKKAYKAKTLFWHPDKEGNSSEWAANMFHRVQAAYTALRRKD